MATSAPAPAGRPKKNETLDERDAYATAGLAPPQSVSSSQEPAPALVGVSANNQPVQPVATAKPGTDGK